MAQGGASGITFSGDDESKYNDLLYKSILNKFSECVPAVEFKDCPQISALLTPEQMQRVQKKFDTEGQNAAGRLLLDFMKMKHGRWYPAMLQALGNESLKLQELKPKFEEIKARVDSDWKQQRQHHLHISNQSSGNLRSPTQVSIPTDGIPPSDFTTNPMNAANVESLQTDMHADHRRSDRLAQGVFLHQSTSDPGISEETDLKQVADSYTDARSSNYARLNSVPAEASGHYEALHGVQQSMDRMGIGGHSIQVDAVIEHTQEMASSSPSEAAVPAEGSQTVQLSQRRFTSREEHPSLKNAISNEPVKDFEKNFVASELCTLPGWVAMEEEIEVMELLKSKIGDDGTYVIWYWALAKRPTVCVTYRRKLVTFVVHKSMSERPSFYINRRQKKDKSLKALVRYHLNDGVQYTSRDNTEMNVRLITPAT